MSDWSNELVLEFLELYQAEPAIYDFKHPANKNKSQVKDAWLRIRRDLSIHVPLSEIKKKKDSLMASFRHHLRRKKASISSGANSEDIYKPTWYAYDAMERFLGTVYDYDPSNNAENTTTFDEHEDGVSVHEENSRNYDARPKPSPTAKHPRLSRWTTQRRSKRPKELQHAKQQMDQAFAILQDIVKNEDDECHLYGKLIEKKLRKIPESEREQLMYEIDGVFLRVSKRYQGLSDVDHAASSTASSPDIPPVEVHIQSLPSTSASTTVSNTTSNEPVIQLSFHDYCNVDQ